jgi:hypothetical protein
MSRATHADLHTGTTTSSSALFSSRALTAVLPDLAAWGVLVLTITVLLSSRFDHPAVPHDMGTIGHAAERVLQGQLPHGDFDDPYTGLLSMMNAAAFHLFGVSATATRLLLLLSSLAGFTVVYLLCRHAMPPWAAGLVSTTAFLAGVPNYYCSMPTWYNLFCGAAALAALLRFAATDRLRWIAVAGACTGLSFLFKSVGLYFAAAAALFVIFHEQRRAEISAPAKPGGRGGCAFLTIAGLWGYVAAVVMLLWAHPGVPELVTHLAPVVVLVAYLSWNEYQLRFQESRERFVRLLRHGALFAGGFAAIVGCFLVPYALAGKVGFWIRGVFIQPLTRLEDELMGLPLAGEPLFSGSLLVIAFAVTVAVARKGRETARAAAVFAGALALVILAACGFPEVYRAVWGAARLTPLAAAFGLCLALWSERRAVARKRREAAFDQALFVPAFLFVAAASAFSLVQFPLSHGIYFLYVAPLVILAGAHVLFALLPRARAATAIYSGSVLAFVALWILPGHFMAFGQEYYPAEWTTRINGERCPIECDAASANQYTELIQSVKRHSGRGENILALPDSPDVYFFTNRRNPTRTFFDIFDADYATPRRDRRLLDVIEKNRVNVIVLRNHIEFSPEGVSEALYLELKKRFPHYEIITGGAYPKFMVRWREKPANQAPSTPVLAVRK